MKKIALLLVVAFVAAGGWSIGSRLSSDALGMGVGILLGVLAGLPTALLVIAAGQRGGRERDEPDFPMDRDGGYGGYGRFQPQAPVIVLANPGYAPQGMAPQQQGYDPRYALSAPQEMNMPPAQRRFKVVGEQEEWVDEW